MTSTRSRDSDLDALKGFARMVWGNSQAVLKQHPEGFEFIDLGAYFPAFQSFFAGILVHDKLLVRNEYRVALEALETNTYKVGACVTGQPGIGKTIFLMYLIVLRLGKRKPVAVQSLDGDFFYAFFTDTVGFYALNDSTPLKDYPSLWALSDSNKDAESPAGLFKGRQGVRIIQTTPPKASRWKEWSKQVGARPYIMDIWSEEEVVHLATLLGQDVHRTKTLAERWGNVPRSLVRCIGKDDWAVETFYRAVASGAVCASRIMMDRGPQLDVPNDPLSWFYFLRPMKTPTGAISRRHAYLSVPTPTIRSILAEALQGQDNLVKLQFYNALSHHPNTHQAAGFIFESWFHSFFIVKKKINCQWVVGSSVRAIVRFPTMSTAAGVHLIPTTKNAPKSAEPPYYWIPSGTNFPGINSALVLKHDIFVFQVTVSSAHTSPIDGLHCLREMLPRNSKNLPWRMVFVGPEEGPIQAVANYWGDQLFFPPNKKLAVGWSVVDPVQDSVTYREFHDDSPTELEESSGRRRLRSDGPVPTSVGE